MTRNQSAFTVFELLTCIALLAIVLAIAVPAMAQMVQNHRDTALRHQLTALLQSARAQAIMQKHVRTVCGSNDGINCTGHWGHNWLLVSHNNELIQQVQVPQSSAICWNGFNKNIKYHSNGTSPTSNGRFAVCRNGVSKGTLVLNRQGRLRVVWPDHTATCC